MTPPDAVSGAATPAQQPSEVPEPTCKHCGKEIEMLHLESPTMDYWVHRYQYGIKPNCWNNDFTRRDTVAEPAATPEAQIPEHIDKMLPKDLAIHCAALEARLLRSDAGFEDEGRRADRAESQLTALRVERDRAWNEALEAARSALSAAGRPVNCISTIRSLARPIPAEPVETPVRCSKHGRMVIDCRECYPPADTRKEVPNGVD